MPSTSPLKFPDLRGLTLLVVDDNDDAVDILTKFLKACGAEVLFARNAMTAWGYVAAKHKLDAVITDIAMPGMDGMELARRLRDQPSARSVPLIALTGFYDEYKARENFDAFLCKPVDLDKLGEIIRSLTRR